MHRATVALGIGLDPRVSPPTSATPPGCHNGCYIGWCGTIDGERAIGQSIPHGTNSHSDALDFEVGASGHRRPTATWRMIPAPMKVRAAVVTQSSGVALGQSRLSA